MNRFPKFLTEAQIEAILEQVGPDEYPLPLYATLRAGKGKSSMRWAGEKTVDSPKSFAATIMEFYSAVHGPHEGNPLVARQELPELFRHSREVIEKAEVLYEKAPLKIKAYLKRRTLPTSTFGHMAHMEIVMRDWGVVKEACYALFEEAKVPNKKKVRLESARWGIKREAIIRNIRMLEKRSDMKLRCHSTKAGVIIERLR